MPRCFSASARAARTCFRFRSPRSEALASLLEANHRDDRDVPAAAEVRAEVGGDVEPLPRGVLESRAVGPRMGGTLVDLETQGAAAVGIRDRAGGGGEGVPVGRVGPDPERLL